MTLLRELISLVDAGFEVTFARDLSPQDEGLVIRAANADASVVSRVAGVRRNRLDASGATEEQVRLELLRLRKKIAGLSTGAR
jgi:hypothetical protein